MTRSLRLASTVAAAALLATAASGCIIATDDDGDSTLTVINDSSYDIDELYVTDVGSPDWGPDLVSVLPANGGQVTILVECGDYDVLVRDETGVDCPLYGISLCFDDDAWIITDAALDDCAFSQ